MTVNSEDTPRVQYTANGITTIFPITFVYDDISDVHVYFISNSTGLATAWTKDASGPTGYTVSAGAIVANTAPSNGYLVAVCTTPVTQLVDVKPNRALTADTLEGVFDKLTLIGRDLKGSVSRALIYGPTYTGSIPYAEDLADEIKQDSVDASVAAVNALTFATSLHIDNIAALRLFPGGETTSIYLDCHTSQLDGGHGAFDWDADSTATDNNGTIIQVTGVATGRWLRQTQGYVTPEMFGAIGNGTANDRTAILAASAYKHVKFDGNKSYLITSNLTVNLTDDTLWEGENARIILNTPGSYGITINTQDHNFRAAGIKFDGDNESPYLLYVYQTTTANNIVKIDKCKFVNGYATTNDNVYGLFIRGGYLSVTLDGCTFSDFSRQVGTGNPGVVSIAGAVLQNYDTDFIENAIVSNCTFKNITNKETAASALNTDVDGLKIFTNNIVGVRQGVASVTNCAFINCKGRGVKAQNNKTVVTNCHFYKNINGIIGGGVMADFQVGSGAISGCTVTYEDEASGEATMLNGGTVISGYSTGDEAMIRNFNVSDIQIFDKTTGLNSLYAIFAFSAGYSNPTTDNVINISNIIADAAAQYLMVGQYIAAGSTGKSFNNLNNIYIRDLEYALFGFGGSPADKTLMVYNCMNITHAAAAVPLQTFTYATGTPATTYIKILASTGYTTDEIYGQALAGGLTSGVSALTNSLSYKSIQLADDATGSLSFPFQSDRGFFIMTSNANRNFVGIFTRDSSGLVALNSSVGANVSLGNTTNPNVDGNVNLWYDADTLYIKNRVGGTQTFKFLGF